MKIYNKKQYYFSFTYEKKNNVKYVDIHIRVYIFYYYFRNYEWNVIYGITRYFC